MRLNCRGRDKSSARVFLFSYIEKESGQGLALAPTVSHLVASYGAAKLFMPAWCFVADDVC
jgi:hypothetical protein